MSSIIAIDGPSASGKSSVSKLVARRLGFTHVDSGSFYRNITLEAIIRKSDLFKEDDICKMIDSLKIDFIKEDISVVMIIDGQNHKEKIRSLDVSNNVSIIAAIPKVRQKIVSFLREMTRFGNLVMEGRDIGTVVFPDTKFKYYLEASAEERVRRRALELKSVGAGVQKNVQENIEKRDKMDSTRNVAPLKKAKDALLIDTTNMTIEEVAEQIISDIRAKR